MIVRELKVAGELVPIGGTDSEKWQHHGYGRELLQNCEDICQEEHVESILIMSGVGVRDYYRRFGYERYGPYMMKRL
jgi:elongator complex protein 3